MATDLTGMIRWIEQSLSKFDRITLQVERLYQSLVARLSPLIEQLKPIWQDPLWQMIGLILLVIIVVGVGLWLIKKGSKWLLLLTKSLVRFMSWLVDLFSMPVLWLIKKFRGKEKPKNKKKSYRQLVGMAQIRRAVNAIEYLTTQREWRYQVEWSLIIGQEQSGKSQLVQSIKQGKRAQLLPREKRLLTAASGWHFFDHGVVIESSIDTLDDNLEQLNWYRPERALDKIILCISAESLLHPDAPAALEELGEQLFQQLWKTQKKTGFVLPVYVFITQCDRIEGFPAFWKAQDEKVKQQMIGWSNPYRLETAFNVEWIHEAFTQLLASLQITQLQVASGGEEIADIDRFMLYIHQFSALQQPLTKVMASTFVRSSLQEALPLRGIYFCGQLDDKTAFIEDVFQQKIFAEKHLSSILEKRRFSNNKVLRQFQIGVLATALVMSLLFVFDVTRVVQFNTFSQDKLKQLHSMLVDCSAQGADTFRLMQGLSDVGERLLTISMPLSWLDMIEVEKQQLVAQHLLEKNLFIALECRLKQRADALLLATQTPLAVGNYQALSQQLEDYQQNLIEFENEQASFETLAGPLKNNRGLSTALAKLLNYLYDNPVPNSINFASDLIVGAVRRAEYSPSWMRNDESLVSRQLSTQFLETLTGELQIALLQHAENIPLAPLEAFNAQTVWMARDRRLPASTVIQDYKKLRQWTVKTSNDWLANSNSTSPCGRIAEQMNTLRQELVVHGFDSRQLEQLAERFSPQSCDQIVRESFAELSFAPFGALFEFGPKGLLIKTPELQKLAEKVEAITELSFVKDSYPPVIDSSEGVDQWQQAPLQQLIDVLVNYQQFTDEHGDTALFNSALDVRLQQVTERLLSAAMIRPAQRIKAPKPVNDLIDYRERSVADAVNSFKQVQELLLQIQILLQQLGDTSNVLRLNQQVQKFILQQLTQLDRLVSDYQLYQPLPFPQWQKPDFAQAMFNIQDDKQAELYLTNQQQKMSYFAFNYAQPLLQYLQNSDTGLSDPKVQIWMATLQDLGRFERGEPNNQVVLLNDLVTQKLADISNSQCPQSEYFDATHSSGSWFAKRREQIEQQVGLHCSSADKKALVARYTYLAERFNQEVAGRYPFAEIHQAGNQDLNSKALQAFLKDYHEKSENLLADLDKQNQKDGSIPASWREFIEQMNVVDDFFAQTWQAKNKQWQVHMQVTFDAQGDLLKASEGSNQIIEWVLQSGRTQALFPNGNNTIIWSPGSRMQLDLRWATGSAYLPIGLPGIHSDPTQLGTAKALTASFVSRGPWGLFEWLTLYASDSAELDNESMLSFYVPVGVKGERVYLEEPAYVSRSNLLVQAFVSDDKGEQHAIVLPRHFPTQAPGLND
ncbi:type VI secretion system protein [Marinomonas sp. RS-M-Aa-14]|uniref:type VI secretion system protein n=1 Tax=Marinomonas sp. RS-M-Aa-14 TaxID=3241169 RepID=UPI00390C55E6